MSAFDGLKNDDALEHAADKQMSQNDPLSQNARQAACARIWVGKLSMTDFRSYDTARLIAQPEPVVLLGPNGAGKTNCLEALSLLSAGRGLRAQPFSELARQKGAGGWAVSAQVWRGDHDTTVGTGLYPEAHRPVTNRSARLVKIDGALAKSSTALADIRMLWLTPAMDGLFTGPASDRRRFLDRFALSLSPDYARAAAAYERAMRQRNKALETGAPSGVLDAIEIEMGQAAVYVAAERVAAIAQLQAEILAERDRELALDAPTIFPWAQIALVGDLEQDLASGDAACVLERYRGRLADMRDRDAAAGRTLVGPHRTDFLVSHGPRAMPGKLCSTGEQKALLIALILAQARLIKHRNGGMAPLLLLDEIAAHLDEHRRSCLFSALLALQAQVWMTGTELEPFSALYKSGTAQFFLVSNGTFESVNDAETVEKH